MEPLSISLPTRPVRHYSYSFDTPTSLSRAPYLSPEPSPTSPTSYPQATPLMQHACLTAPRGYPAGSVLHPQPLFTNAELQVRPGPNGYHGYDPTGKYYGGAQSVAEMDPYYVPALPPRKEEKKPRKPRKTPEVKQPTFLTKLYGILNQEEYNHIIRWDEDGEIIIIERPEELANKVLPLVYRQSRFASFSRQLNIYGFMRKVSLRHVEARISDPDASTWSHGTLRRDSPMEEVIAFKRRVPPRPTQSKRRSSAPEAMLSPTESDLSDPSDAYHHHLMGDDNDRLHPSLPAAQQIPFRSPDKHNAGINEELSPDSDDFVLQPELHQTQTPQHQQQGTVRNMAFGAAPGPSRMHPDLSTSAIPPSSAFMPQSAPVIGRSYMDVQVMQGHLRTRSVQGEPPSATLWSPAPFGSTQWLPNSANPPSSALSLQQTPFGQEGWVNCYTHEPIDPPQNSLGMIGARMASFDGPSSVPTSFAPSMSSSLTGNAFLGDPFQLTTQPYSSTNNQFDEPHSPTTDRPPATVSPGVYQSGFTPPVNVLTRSVSSPRPTPSHPATISRQDRRQSISSTPYSPQQRHKQPLSLAQLSMSPSRGPLRGLGAMSDGYKSSTMGTPEMGIPELAVGIVNVDDGLPSAGMEGMAEYPFQGLLRKDEFTDGEDA